MSNAYYDALAARPDTWKKYSLRDGVWDNASCKFDPVMDAMKLTIPAFRNINTLAGPMDATTDLVPMNTTSAASVPQSIPLRIDSEIMTVVGRVSATQVRVTRHTHGTAPAAHATGTTVTASTNSLQSQVRLPFGTSDGHQWTCIWDVMTGPSLLNRSFTFKAFQFSSGGTDGDTIWLEPRYSLGSGGNAGWDPAKNIARLNVRSYQNPGEIGPADWMLSDGNHVGPGSTWPSGDSIGPSGSFWTEVNSWTRFFWQIQQEANNYDPANMWVADETRDAVHILKGPRPSVRPTGRNPNCILKFWLEWNTSTDDCFRPNLEPYVLWVRNVWMGKDVGDITPLLIRPEGGIPPPPIAPPTAVEMR